MRLQPHGLRLNITTNWKQRSNFYFSSKYYSLSFWQTFYILELFKYYHIQTFSIHSGHFVFIPYFFFKLTGARLFKTFLLRHANTRFLKHKEQLIKTSTPHVVVKSTITKSLKDLLFFQKSLLKFNFSKFTVSEFFLSLLFFKKYFRYFKFTQFRHFKPFIPVNVFLIIKFIRAYFFLRFNKSLLCSIKNVKFFNNYLLVSPLFSNFSKVNVFSNHFLLKTIASKLSKFRYYIFTLIFCSYFKSFFFFKSFFLKIHQQFLNLIYFTRRIKFKKNLKKKRRKNFKKVSRFFNKKAYFQQKQAYYTRLKRLKKYTSGYYNFLTFLTRRSKPFLSQLFLKYPFMVFFKVFFKNSSLYFFKKTMFTQYYSFSNYLYFGKQKTKYNSEVSPLISKSLQLGFLDGDFFSKLRKKGYKNKSKKLSKSFASRTFNKQKGLRKYFYFFKKKCKSTPPYRLFRIWFFLKKRLVLTQKFFIRKIRFGRKRFLKKKANNLFLLISQRLLKKKLFIFSHNYISLYFQYFLFLINKNRVSYNLRFFHRFFLSNPFFKVYTNFFYFNSFNVLSLKYPFFSLSYFKCTQQFKPQYVHKIKSLFDGKKAHSMGLEDIYHFPGPYFRLPPMWRFDFFSKLVFALSLQQSELILDIIIFYFEKTKNHTAFWSLLNFILMQYSLVIPGLQLTVSGKFRPRYGGKKIKKKKRTYKYGLPISLQSFNTSLCYSERAGNSYLGAFGFKLILLKKYGSAV